MEKENMNVFVVKTKVFIGVRCFGAAVTKTGEAILELTDEELKALVDLINETETTDVEEMELEEKLPEIYDKIDEANLKAACIAEEDHWLEDGWGNPDVFEPTDYLEYAEKELGYKFEYNPEDYVDEDGELDEDTLEDEKIENFQEWLTNYKDALQGEERRDFMRQFINVEIDDVDYKITIPQEIIDMTNL